MKFATIALIATFVGAASAVRTYMQGHGVVTITLDFFLAFIVIYALLSFREFSKRFGDQSTDNFDRLSSPANRPPIDKY